MDGSGNTVVRPSSVVHLTFLKEISENDVPVAYHGKKRRPSCTHFECPVVDNIQK